MADDINIKLSKDQYTALVKLVYFGDFCISNQLLCEFNNSQLQGLIASVVEEIYKYAEKLDIPSSISLNSLASSIPFSEEESDQRRALIEADLDKISKILFANEFAKRDLNIPKSDYFFSHEGGWLKKRELILEHREPYLKEFEKNGISNLRFKMFHRLNNKEDT